MTVLVLALLGWLVLLTLVFAGWQGRLLYRLWREPMLRYPVVIIESDDWGPGPSSDGDALQQIAAVLDRHRDGQGRCAVMTLGMVLAAPNPDSMTWTEDGRYAPAMISEPRFHPILAAIGRGVAAGAFAPQLHGMEHYWPGSLMIAARSRDDVRAWLTQNGVPRTEDLPSPLQSRWVDASVLPSQPLPDQEIAAAARGEAEEFARTFGAAARVVVPPTFVWTDAVEVAWARSGVEFIVTPGTRYLGRDAQGGMIGAGERFCNGQASASGVRYLVRDDYFEPALGHTAERALDALAAKSRAGRPTLLETHRFNFIGSKLPLQDALRELERLLEAVTRSFPGIRFLSTYELGVAFAGGDAGLVETSFMPRLRVWLARAWQIPRLRKLAIVTGAIVPAVLLHRVAAGAVARSGAWHAAT